MGVEVRWFFEGPLPANVSVWFANEAMGEVPPTIEKRTDLYLATREDIGVKLREGRLEIKWRSDLGQPLMVSARVQGQTECWDKWSWKDPQGKAEAQIADLLRERSDHPWTPVQKERHQRKYELSADGWRPILPEDRVEQGVILELTKPRVQGRSWWTVGLDLLGKARNADESLKEAKEVFEKPLARLFEKYPGPALKLDNSYGYPKFVLATEIMSEMADPVERPKLILTILDRIMPIPEEAPDDVKAQIDVERQMVVLREEWNKMPIEELRALEKRLFPRG